MSQLTSKRDDPLASNKPTVLETNDAPNCQGALPLDTLLLLSSWGLIRTTKPSVYRNRDIYGAQ